MSETTTPAKSTTGASADDMARLTLMRDVAQRILTDAGIDPDRVRCEIRQTMMGTLNVGEWRKDGGMALWYFQVTPPWDSPISVDRVKAELQVHGIVTPLCMRVLTVIDGLMWQERET